MVRRQIFATWARRAKALTDRFRRPYQQLTDGEFIQTVIAPIAITPLLPPDIEFWQATLNEKISNRGRVAKILMDNLVWRQRHGFAQPDGNRFCWLMGTDRILDKKAWLQRVAALGLPSPDAGAESARDSAGFTHRGRYDVSAIVSLFKGGRYIRTFLENITSQTLFDRSELIIIDANSPESEKDVIADFMKVYPNIVYHHVNFQIGIYEAWNIGVKLARGTYLTNANVDDLRRRDSFELQAVVLDRHAFVDVVYQDVFYSMDDRLSFEDVERCGFKSDLPVVTVNNLLAFNTPHNAPMWRRRLHDEIGLFDPTLRSAGDHDFWLKCIARGKTFFKINTPHVVYFNNPDGISTRPESPGLSEGPQIQRRWAQSLTSRHLLSSKSAFLASVCPNTKKFEHNRFVTIHRALCSIAEAFHEYEHVRARAEALGRPARLVVDGLLFCADDDAVRARLDAFISGLAACEGVDITLLDRGRCPEIARCERLEFPSYTFTNTAADSLLIEKLCLDCKADLFLSTFYTTPLTVPTILIIGGEVAVPSAVLEARAALEREIGVAFASRYLCLAGATAPQFRGKPVDPRRVYTPKNDDFAEALQFVLGAHADRADPRAAAFFADWSRLRAIQAEVDTFQLYPDWDAYHARDEA